MTFFRSLLVMLLAAYARSNDIVDDSSLRGGRELAYEWIAGYEPRTLVTDHAAIDLDQEVIERLLAFRRLDDAKAIYKKGGHSQPIAQIQLVDADPPVMPIPAGTIVIGWSNNGDMVRGRLLEETTWTSEETNVTIFVEYQRNEAQESYLNCEVGGLVEISEANGDGCK
jgi:hypothetical protein